MSVYEELLRLRALSDAANADCHSCPRNREILLAKIADLKQAAREQEARIKDLAERLTKAKKVNETERKRLARNLNAMRAMRVELGHGGWESDNILMWEMEMVSEEL